MSNAKSGFLIERRDVELRFRIASMTAREWLSVDFVRIRLSGDDLIGFDSLGSDDHIRLFFPSGPDKTVEELRASPSREYTPLAWGDDWLDVEFAVHGNEGIAASWAATAALGSPIGVGGPRRSAVITGRPDSWFLVGDETAIPAIHRFAGLIPAGMPARVVIETPSASGEVDIDAAVPVEWLHRGTEPAGSALIALLDELTADDAVGDDPFVFIAAEQSIVKPGRALLGRWGIDPSRATVKGYWKNGEAEYAPRADGGIRVGFMHNPPRDS